MASKPPGPPAPLAAIALTVAALTIANLALAYLLAGAIGSRPLELPDLAVWGLLLIGLLATGGAALQWRSYLRQSRASRGAPRVG